MMQQLGSVDRLYPPPLSLTNMYARFPLPKVCECVCNARDTLVIPPPLTHNPIFVTVVWLKVIYDKERKH